MKLTNLDWPLIVAALFPWAAIAVTALITPRITRPDLFFAVTVSPAFRPSPAGREILRRYDRSVILVALIALLLAGLVRAHSTAWVVTGLLGPTGIEIVGWFCAFISARHRTLPHHVEPTAEREAEVQPRHVPLPGGWLAQAGPFLILATTCLCLGLRWDSIPARIPIHWGASGRPDGWAAKSPAAVFGTATIGVLTCSFLAVIWYATVRGVRRIHSSGTRAIREARFVWAMSLFLLGVEYWMALLFGLFSLAALRSEPEAPLPAFWPIFLGQTLVVGTICLLAYRAGQGGWRWGIAGEGRGLESDASPVGDRTPDECWKAGIFYVNREDPALFVEKRFGIGWTLNFGNWRAVFVVAGILLFLFLALGLSFYVSRGGGSVSPH